MSQRQVQVEVQFTIQHTMDELKDRFVRAGQFPDWEPLDCTDCASGLSFLEKRLVSFNLNSEDERYAWFVFSIEACGRLERRVVIPNIVPSGQNIDNLDLTDFLKMCRELLIPQQPQASPL